MMPEPKRKSKKKVQKTDEDGDSTFAGDGSEVGNSDESMKEILKDSKLKVISDALGNVPPCFAALLPQKILENPNFKFGHQIKGVRCFGEQWFMLKAQGD